MNIGIYIYNNAEVLDFSGPFEVFSVAKRLAKNNWNVFLISESGSMVGARGNYLIQPHYSISSHPIIDVLLVAGGVHTEEIKKENVISWIAKISESAKYVASVYTGCFLLAETGLLNGYSVTTHWEDIPDLQARYPPLNVLENQRWIQTNKFLTSGGISSGIDMSLFMISKLISMEMAEKTAIQMEYHWTNNT